MNVASKLLQSKLVVVQSQCGLRIHEQHFHFLIIRLAADKTCCASGCLATCAAAAAAAAAAAMETSMGGQHEIGQPLVRATGSKQRTRVNCAGSQRTCSSLRFYVLLPLSLVSPAAGSQQNQRDMQQSIHRAYW